MLTWPPTAATVLLFWPLITGFISLFYNYLDGIPRVHAFLSILVKAGLDLPSILADLKRLLTGQSVAAQKAARILPLALLVVGLSACPLPAAVPGDLAADYACVQQGVASHETALQIEAQCLPGQLQTVLDIVSSLLASPQWRAAHPDQISIAEGVKAEAQVKLGAGSK